MTRVLVVDDSSIMRQVLSHILNSHPGLEVVGTASDPYEAWERMKVERPDVMTLDVEMPKMDGLRFLKRVMEHVPLPVVMVSSLTERGAETTLRALELGAVDFVTKPTTDVANGMNRLGAELVRKVVGAARARVRPLSGQHETPQARARSDVSTRPADRIIAIGASTGGVEALRDVVSQLPPDCPGVVVVQHMPAGFTAPFAKRLDSLSRVRVAEAQTGDRVLRGAVLIAPGDQHMQLVKNGGHFVVELTRAPKVNHHRPSVDVLFDSCARVAGGSAVGVILTGMGDDGARGMLTMHRAGCHTIAQDETSCVVFGMPREAIERGAAKEIVPLSRVASAALRASMGGATRA